MNSNRIAVKNLTIDSTFVFFDGGTEYKVEDVSWYPGEGCRVSMVTPSGIRSVQTYPALTDVYVVS